MQSSPVPTLSSPQSAAPAVSRSRRSSSTTMPAGMHATHSPPRPSLPLSSREFLTGFHKRKLAKAEAARAKAKQREKDERQESRREVRVVFFFASSHLIGSQQRRHLREKAVENAAHVEKAYGATTGEPPALLLTRSSTDPSQTQTWRRRTLRTTPGPASSLKTRSSRTKRPSPPSPSSRTSTPTPSSTGPQKLPPIPSSTPRPSPQPRQSPSRASPRSASARSATRRKMRASASRSSSASAVPKRRSSPAEKHRAGRRGARARSTAARSGEPAAVRPPVSCCARGPAAPGPARINGQTQNSLGQLAHNTHSRAPFTL